MSRQGMRQRRARRRAERLKAKSRKAFEGQPAKAFTNLECYNVTDKSIFLEGLRKAGLKLIPGPSSSENDPNQVVIFLQSQEDAYQIMKALHGCTLKGRTMHIDIIDVGTQVGHMKGQLPKVKWIRGCVLDAFHVRAYEADRAEGTLEYAVARPNARANIKVPKVAITKQKANEDLTKEEEEAVAMEIPDSESDESEGLDEEIHKQKGGKERGEKRDGSSRPETSARQHMEVDKNRSSLRSERSQSQDTACEGERSYGSSGITSTRSSTPDDILSALYASLN